jgi:hypothetical protein
MQNGLLIKSFQELQEENTVVAVRSMMDRESLLATSRYIFNTSILPLKFIINTLLWDWSDGNKSAKNNISNPSKSSVSHLLVLRKLAPQSSMNARIESCDFGSYLARFNSRFCAGDCKRLQH